ncbi:MAG: hypothetical protein Q7R73_05055 [bacterium]|nr:hypothetical protein [bacterium]
MTPEKYEHLRKEIRALLPANEWLRRKMLAAPKEQTMLNITFKTPHMIYLSPEVDIGEESVLHGKITLAGATKIGRHCILSDNTHIQTSTFGDYVYIGPGAQINRATIGSGTDIPHRCYIGDTQMGEGVNFGDDGTTSNFDGINKNKTVIEDDCFIGTQIKMVPPLRIGRESYVAAIYLAEDIPPHSLVIQVMKPLLPKGKTFADLLSMDVEEIKFGFAVDIKPNRSFKIAPGKWLKTKKPIEPARMKEFLKKIKTFYPNPWQKLSDPLPVFGNKTAIDILKSEGEEGLAKLMNELSRMESGGFS